MAAQRHAEFEELCALASSRELSDEEKDRLRQHLEYCDVCKAALHEYNLLDADVLSAVGALTEPTSIIEDDTGQFDTERGERRLIEALEAQEKSDARARITKLATKSGQLMVLIGGFVVLLSIVIARTHPHPGTAAIPVETRPVEPKIMSRAPAPSPDPALLRLVTRLHDEKEALEGKLKQAKANSSAAQATIDDLTGRLRSQEDTNLRLKAEQAQFAEQLATLRADAVVARATVMTAASTTAHVASLQQEVQGLRSELEQQTRDMAERTELLSHDRDIRDLIGARDLLITEIYDVSKTGARNKPFGRIFYTKDKSLIFYGYDLDKQMGLKREAAFQAWGSNGDGQNVSLGLFYQDDSKKRWILKFNDAKTLAHLNSVFVTVEPEGGSAKPTGKPMLMALLRIEPNHP